MVKFKQQFKDMLEYHADLFGRFRDLSSKVEQEPTQYRDEFDEIGREVLQIIRRYDNMLCSKSEGGKFGKFSGNLSEKFWEEVRKEFPKIDDISVPKVQYKKI